MGKTKRPATPGPAPAAQPQQQPGPMDEYLSTPRGLQGTRDRDNMAPASPGTASMAESTPDPQDMDALTQISVDLAAISATMLTRKDKTEMVAELRSVIREEIAAV
ncbi:Hypothetical predicted protein [Pelobates cultripes]|uniref:Uncharacterized protein n=1 Tax=Pelobates cultripes TaxID=61616 RepID=A0AAD1WAN9_PELCU|nr:Hypothetical predicted protein [Pelobates cultripes]